MLFYIRICLTAGVIAVAMDSIAVTATSVKFRSKRVNGKLLCAIDSADVSIPVRSRLECSTKCQKDVKCLAVNYKDGNKHAPVCEILHYYHASKTLSVLPNCAHFQHLERTRIIDCSTIIASGIVQSGVYNATVGGQSFPVYCDMVTDGGGWTVVQRRQDGSVDFYRNWFNYTNGFGYLAGEFWLGNEYLNLLTSSTDRQYELRFDMADFENVTRFAKYSNFVVGPEMTYYKLTFAALTTGNTGDSLRPQNGMMFTTFDSDHDNKTYNCATQFKGGYWYNNCHASNPNGLYLRGNHTQYAVGVEWASWHGYFYSLRFVEMKIRAAA